MTFHLNDYLDALARCNNLVDTENIGDTGDTLEWCFYPGMLLGSRAKWWADFGVRHAAHEGLDICMYRTSGGEIARLSPSTRIPAMEGGVVVNVCGDFLGRTVVVQHHGTSRPDRAANERPATGSSTRSGSDNGTGRSSSSGTGTSSYNCTANGRRTGTGTGTGTATGTDRRISVYSHLSVNGSVDRGAVVEKNDILGRIADTSGRKSGIPCHLHLSIMEVTGEIARNQLNWKLFGRPDPHRVKLFNPWTLAAENPFPA
ncbi:MAG: hypothetical protein R6V54_00975 [Desulfobacteraceae bacterium]